ncbi:DUF6924 domain-containing protein [Actinomadura gamaensis]|uniref:DUF6924 domain-containing protein n=1 Tax=Actinomadura gamaensis TaxID=1763541 RepID=A0ABV9U475_9ACTN
MPFAELPRPAPGEVLLVSTCYEHGKASWGGLLGEIGGRRDGDVVPLEDGRVRLRLVGGREWDYMHGGNVPALVPEGASMQVAVLADIPVVHGGDGPLLVDLASVPGRGVRVPPARLGEILLDLRDGPLTFDDLVRGMDLRGMYEGDAGEPEFPVPATAPPKRDFPSLPATEVSVLVRTCFDDEDGWRGLLTALGGVDADGWVGTDLDLDEIDVENYPLTAVVVDDRAFEDLQPGQVPALVPAREHTTLVALADARTFAEPGRPLTVVDLYDAPGNVAVLPARKVGSLACNLDLANMDFFEFVLEKGAHPWWDDRPSGDGG